MSIKEGYYMRVIDGMTKWQQGTTLRVSGVFADPDGTVQYSFEGDNSVWLDWHFEMALAKDVVTLMPDKIEVDAGDYNKLLKDAQMLRALYSTNVRDWCGFSDSLEEYRRLEKENNETVP